MEKQILDRNDMERIISRIANQILERNLNPSSICIIGIKKRGDILAKKIAKKIESIDGCKMETSALDITFYRDDVQLKAYKYVVKGEIQFDTTDRNVVLVDDVIFTGRSIRAAIEVLIDTGRPQSVQLAVLIDRGGRELPIQPDFVGQRIETRPDEIVDVRVVEVDDEDGGWVMERE